jgi:hypothetical protein
MCANIGSESDYSLPATRYSLLFFAHGAHEMTRKTGRSGLTAKCAKGHEVRIESDYSLLFSAHGTHGIHGRSEGGRKKAQRAQKTERVGLYFVLLGVIRGF